MSKEPGHHNVKNVRKILLSMIIVLVIIYVIPFFTYSLFTLLSDLKAPQEVSPLLFLTSVLVSKVGVAVVFVLILHFSGAGFKGRWLLYAFLWWLLFVIDEIGQSIGTDYTWKEAIAGIISETIYVPLSAYVVNWLLSRKTE